MRVPVGALAPALLPLGQHKWLALPKGKLDCTLTVCMNGIETEKGTGIGSLSIRFWIGGNEGLPLEKAVI